MKNVLNKQTFAWALYDWANSAYATIVLAVFFQILFSNYWFVDSGYTNTTTPLGIANAIASLFIVVLAPVLGAIADRGGLKKRFLTIFAFVGIIFTTALYFVTQGEWLLALVVYVVSRIGFAGANVFYDSLIVNVSPRNKLDIVSALGFSFGYLGGGLVLLIAVLFHQFQEFFGFSSVTQANLASFVLVAIWWALFSIPLLKIVREPEVTVEETTGSAIRDGISQLVATFREIRQLRVVFLFLLAYWFYIDGVDTIVIMAVDYGKRLNFTDSHLVFALLITQFVGFPAAILYGMFGERIGAKNGILVAIVVYIVITLWGYYMDNVAEFYFLAAAVGLVQGGVQSLSRSLFASIIPANKSAEFFGFYNMIGKFAAVLGPLLMALVSGLTGSPRLAILSIILLFFIGGLFLLKVNIKEGMTIARELEQ